MSLNLVIGSAIYDKDKYIYTKAAELENQGFSPVIFVPSQARMSAEEMYLKVSGKSGMMYSNITTLSRYISKVLSQVSIEKEYITDEIKRMYVKQIINENKSEITVFANVINKPSFIDLILTYIDSIKRENIDISKIDEINNISSLTKAKLNEIARICEIVDKKLKDKYIDSLDMIDIFCQYISEHKCEFEKSKIFFHGYNNFSKKELNVIDNFLKLGVEVTVSLTLPYDMATNEVAKEGVFEIAYRTYCDLMRISADNRVQFCNVTKLEKINTKEDITHLMQNIFSPQYEMYNKKSENVSLKLAKNLNYEIEEIAKDIVYKTRKDKNTRYNDFAIYTNNFEAYEFCIKRIFGEYNIAYSFDDSSEIEFSNICIYILNLLKLIENGIDMNNLFVILKTGLSSVSKEDLNYFENYILEFGIKGYMLNRAFVKNNKEELNQGIVYDLNRLNLIRENIIKKIKELTDELKVEQTAKSIVQKVYKYITENDVIKRYDYEIKNTANINIKQSDLKRQTLEAIYEIMDDVCNVCGDNKISISLFIELFEFGIKDRKIKTIPMTIDQVEICDMNKTRILPKKYVYFIGAYENGLPAFSKEDVMFSDKELEELKENKVEIKQDSITRTNMALFNVYIALASVTEHLSISMPVSQITGEPLRLGVILKETKRILNIPILGNITSEDEFAFEPENMTDKVMFKNLLQQIVDIENLDEEEAKRAYSLYLYYTKKSELKEYKEILEYVREDNELSKETLEKLYKKDLNTSVSKLETFKKCPFSYYVNYVLRIKPLKRYSMSIIDIGTLMHDVLEKFSKWLMSKSYLWQQVINEEKINKIANDKVNEIVDNIFEEKYSKYKESNRYIVLKASLKRKMFKVITIIAKSFNQSDFKPLGYEIEFKNGGLYSPIEVNLENGKKMYLIGKIDRVDTACINDKIYVRIIDYKSSNRTINLNDIKEGISLQLMTYMSALINNKENIDKEKEVLPAAINYFSLKTNIKKISEYEDDMEKINKELIKEMKLKGIYLSDVKVLEGLDRKYKDTSSSFIDINSRNINDKNKVISEEEFKNECVNIQSILKKIGQEITKGITKISPKKCNGKIPCEYCDYMSICRKDIRA